MILQVLVVGREYAHAFILLPLCGEVKLHSYKISTCNLAQQVSHCRVFSYMSCIFDIQPDQPGEHKSYYEKHSRIAIRLAQHSRACYHRLWPSISDAEPGQGKHLNPLIDFDRGMTNPHRCAMVCHGVPHYPPQGRGSCGNPNLVKRFHNCNGPHLFMPFPMHDTVRMSCMICPTKTCN